MIVEVRETQDGFYWQECNRSAKMIPTHAGIIPDAVDPSWTTNEQTSANAPKRMGIFADEMAQNIITQVVNFQLDMVLFDGDESPTLIRNLRHTLVPDIAPNILFLKTIHQNEPENYQPYEDCVDYLLFDP
jgi:phosphoribosylanthranilate isomerase